MNLRGRFRFARRRFDRRAMTKEALAGLPGAIGSVPDGMASSLLAGVNPIHGLYASMAGPLAGGAVASTRLMVVTTTSAAALAAGSTLAGTDEADRPAALFLLTILAGGFMLLAGWLKLGRYTRFVANSVMVGFLTGIAANVALGQVPDVTGADAHGGTAVARAFDVALHPGRIHLPTLLTAASAIAVLLVATRTRLRPVAALAALVLPSIVVAVAGWQRIATVSEVGEIPTGVPLPALPELRFLSAELVVGALAIAIIVLVQGAGVSQAAPNPDGSASNANQDFLAQGAGNVAAGLLQGQPVGGSVGQTALNISAGARSRWAAIFSGLWMLLILVVFSTAVGHVVMATLAALLIYAAVGSIRPSEVQLIWRTSTTSQVAGVTTFVCTLLLPVAAAVGIGVALSLLLQVNRSALDLAVVSLTPVEDGTVRVGPVPPRLQPRSVTVIDVYGSLLFAGARTLQLMLPDPAGATGAAVVLRLRGRTTLSATAIDVVAGYADRLDAVGGRLFLSGVDPAMAARLRRSRTLDALGPVELVHATAMLGESSRQAYARARAWVTGPGSDTGTGR